MPLDGLDAGTLLARADQRLMAAKRAGRDRSHADDRETYTRVAPTGSEETRFIS